MKAATTAMETGVRLIQYRDKRSTRREIYEISLRLAELIHRAGGIFIVNDHADIARAVDADGVHLGQDDLPIQYGRKIIGRERIIGISTHSVRQALDAQAAGADYIGFGPVFPTGTKDAGPVQGMHVLRELRNVVSAPVLAIGGITPDRVADIYRAGADGVAVIGAVLKARDMRKAARDFLTIIKDLPVRTHEQ